MKKLIVATFLIILPLIHVYAVDYIYQSYINNGIAIVCVNNSRIRSKPDLNSDIIQTIALGTKITVIERTDVELLLNGKVSNWYRVNFNDRVGYIWGGLISDSFFSADFDFDGKEEIFVIQRHVRENSSFERNLSFSVNWECTFTLIDGSAIAHDKLFLEKFIGIYDADKLIFRFNDSSLVLLRVYYSFADGNEEESFSKLFYFNEIEFKALINFREHHFTEADTTEHQIMKFSTEIRGGDRFVIMTLEKEVIVNDISKKQIIKVTTIKWANNNTISIY